MRLLMTTSWHLQKDAKVVGVALLGGRSNAAKRSRYEEGASFCEFQAENLESLLLSVLCMDLIGLVVCVLELTSPPLSLGSVRTGRFFLGTFSNI